MAFYAIYTPSKIDDSDENEGKNLKIFENIT